LAYQVKRAMWSKENTLLQQVIIDWNKKFCCLIDMIGVGGSENGMQLRDVITD